MNDWEYAKVEAITRFLHAFNDMMYVFDEDFRLPIQIVWVGDEGDEPDDEVQEPEPEPPARQEKLEPSGMLCSNCGHPLVIQGSCPVCVNCGEDQSCG